MDELEGMITVRGEAVVPAEPDEVRLRLTVSAVRPKPEEALHEVTTRSHSLEELLTELGIPKPKRSTSGLSVREKREWVDERSVHRGYEAHASLLVRLDEPGIAGRVMQGAVERAQATSTGRGGASTGTILPATRHARKPPATLVAEQRRTWRRWTFGWDRFSRSTRRRLRRGDRGGLLSAGVRAAEATEIEIEAGALDVSASVTVKFAIDR